ncbi:NrtA/SsuA/CpmA family ABC transporter substrate-binding protein [Clostridium oceanicum]|uniref:NrtA/SsuA/CpmA family ABC transporter substrate-binding protein n=1 Tax=Clostridium oceanicum TaxID=1543 RepID=A0ABN1JUL4_9CLOT
MKKFKILSLCMSLLVTSAIFIGCANNDKKTNVKKDTPKEINLTYVKAPLNVPSILEKKQNSFDNAFKKDDIKINWHEITSGPKQTQALASGDLQILHALGGTSAILAKANGVDLKIIGIYSRAPKAFMIISNNPDIKTAKDLKGKKIAGPKGTVLHQLLVGALEKNNLTSKDVNFINMGLPEGFAALNNKNVDAALLAGPVALKAIKNGGKIVANGEGIVDGTIVTAVSKTFLENHKDLVDKFKSTHKETLKFMKEHEEETLKKVSQEVGLTIEETKQMYKWYDFDITIKDKDIKELQKTQDFMIKNGLQDKKIDIKELISK